MMWKFPQKQEEEGLDAQPRQPQDPRFLTGDPKADGGTPETQPTRVSSPVSAAPQQTSEVDDIKALLSKWESAQAESVRRRNQDFMTNFQMIANPDIGKNLAKANEEYYNQPLNAISGGYEAAKSKLGVDKSAEQIDEDRQLSDPNSEMSKAYQRALNNLVPMEGGWSGIAGSQIKTIMPAVTLRNKAQQAAESNQTKKEVADKNITARVEEGNKNRKNHLDVADAYVKGGIGRQYVANQGTIAGAMIKQEGAESLASHKESQGDLKPAPDFMKAEGINFIGPTSAEAPPDNKQKEALDKTMVCYDRTLRNLQELKDVLTAAKTNRPLPAGYNWARAKQSLAAASEALVKSPNANGVANGKDLQFAAQQIGDPTSLSNWLRGDSDKLIDNAIRIIRSDFDGEMHANGFSAYSDSQSAPKRNTGGLGGSVKGPVNPMGRQDVNQAIQNATGGAQIPSQEGPRRKVIKKVNGKLVIE